MAGLTIVWGVNLPGAHPSNSQTAIPDKVAVGQAAPDFTAQTPESKSIKLSDYRGSPVALNFWATWCGPCQVEMPELENASKKYAGNHFVVLGVDAGESADRVKSYVADLGISFTTVLDSDGSIVDLFEIRAFPTTIWIDAKGIVRAKHLGPLTADYIDRYVADLLSR
jgi:thiol-disulfide isomerase/thioredoxin